MSETAIKERTILVSVDGPLRSTHFAVSYGTFDANNVPDNTSEPYETMAWLLKVEREAMEKRRERGNNK